MQSKNLNDVTDRARVCCDKAVEDIAKSPDMLTAEEVSKAIGMSRSIVDVCRENGGLIGFTSGDGYRYPAWQIDKKNGVVIKGIRDALTIYDGCSCAAYRHLMSNYPDKTGEPVYEKLLKGDLDSALSHLNSIRAGTAT